MPALEDASQAYLRAQKSALRVAKTAQQNKKSPYLAALEELVPDVNQLSRISLGIVTIPIDAIDGSVSPGRTPAFACNFMPLLEETTEFAAKWRKLYASVVDIGLREPVKVVEYMNRFYAVEGNKRISVLKFLDSPVIEADVTRIIPRRVDEKDVRIYYEFLSFYDDTGIIDLTFTEEGCYAEICELVSQTPGVRWSADAIMDFKDAFHRFTAAFHELLGEVTRITMGDAFLTYLKAFGYNQESLMTDRIRANMNRVRNEFRTQDQPEPIALKMSADGQKPSLIQQMLRTTPAQLNVCFINNRSPEVSGWTYWHELGKNHVDSVFDKKVTTRMISNVSPDECQSTIERAVAEGANVVFTTSPVLLSGALKAAVQLPNAKILNCSLLPVYNSVRSYYLRMYEAKFIMGAIAGAVSDNNRIGYIADYPVYGIPASVNAFALGARLTNPRASVFLEWSTIAGHDPDAALEKQDVHVICNRDIAAPSFQSTVFGLYSNENGKQHNLAMPVWHWGKLYEDLLRRIQNGFWDTDAAGQAHAMNYWWGMDVGAIDVYYTQKLDPGTRRLIDLLRRQLIAGTFQPFADQITDQLGQVRCKDGESLTPAQIIAIDWLCDNVCGSIPENSLLKPEALPFVELQGLKTAKAPDISEIQWADSAR